MIIYLKILSFFIIGVALGWFASGRARAARLRRVLHPLERLGIAEERLSPERKRDVIARLADEYLASWGGVGLVIGTIDRGRSEVRGFGSTVRGGGDTPDGDTVFEIGSVTKTFTATVLAVMHLSGELDWDTPVEALLPDVLSEPTPERRGFTLLDLATHTSSLPRLPPNLRPGDRRNPYAHYTVQDLYECLRVLYGSEASRSDYRYSNLGYGLLGHLLALRSGRGYADLVAHRLCGPLGMRGTRARPNGSSGAGLARPHNRWGRLVPVWENPTLAGAGCFLSSGGDMLRYLAAHIDGQGGVLRQAMRQAVRKRRPAGMPSLSVGLGWHVTSENALDIVWHDGGTGGSSSFAGLLPEAGLGVVVLANSSAPVSELGREVLYVLARG